MAILILEATLGWKAALTLKSTLTLKSALETALTIIILELIYIVSQSKQAIKRICYLLQAGS
jgi:hypothetical protein